MPICDCLRYHGGRRRHVRERGDEWRRRSTVGMRAGPARGKKAEGAPEQSSLDMATAP